MALKQNKFLHILLGCGLFFIFAGISFAYVSLSFHFFSIGLCLAGLFGIVGFFWALRNSSENLFKESGLKRFGILAAVVGLYVVLYVLLNVVGVLSPYRFDLTQSKQHTLSGQTQIIVNELKKDVRLTALFSGLPPKYLEDLLAQYERQSKGKITAEIIDPLVQIGYAAQFGPVINSRERKLIVQSDNERRDVDFSKELLHEELIDNALVRVTRSLRNVYFLTGHGERRIDDENDEGFSDFVNTLESNNIIVKSLMLETSGGIPEDCDVLVIAGPKKELTEKEEEIIQEYLLDGGDALVLVEHVIVTTPDKPLRREQLNLNPSLNSLLNQWSLEVADDVVVDLESHASGDVGSPATRNYMSHKGIIKGLDYTVYIRPRSIFLKEQPRKTMGAAPFVLTESSESSWGEKNRTLKIEYDEGVDHPGPVPISYVVFEPRASGDSSDTRMIVFTDADFLSNAYLDFYSNEQMGLNVIGWLAESDYKFLLKPKDIKVERLDLTSRQKRVVAVILIGMPLMILIIGLVLWVKQNQS